MDILPLSTSKNICKKITSSESLEEKIKFVVIYVELGILNIYRKSSKELDKYSLDIYKLKDGNFQFVEKDKEKYRPKIPLGAHLYKHDSIGISSMKKLSRDQFSSVKIFLDSIENKK